MRCERCGADAIESNGTCPACGWQAPDGDEQTFGQTRAATGIPPANNTSQVSPGRLGTSSAANPYEPAYPGRTAGAPLAAHFCGACGARLEGQEAFCGQCGAPIAAAPQNRPAVPPTLRSQTPAAANLTPTVTPLGWQTEDHAAYTDAMPEFVGPQPGFAGNRGVLVNGMPGGVPYPQGSQAQSSLGHRGVRSGRIALGVVCLLGSVATAAAAIILAIAPHS